MELADTWGTAPALLRDESTAEVVLRVFADGLERVFNTMVFIPVSCGDPVRGHRLDFGPSVVGAIALNGEDWTGSLWMVVPVKVAKSVVRSMLMMEATDAISEEDIQDAIGELANMVSGYAKGELYDHRDIAFNIGLPSVGVYDLGGASSPAAVAACAVPVQSGTGSFCMVFVGG